MIGARRAGFDRAIVRIGALARFIIFLRMCVCVVELRGVVKFLWGPFMG